MTAVSGATSSSNTDYTTLIKQGSSTFSNSGITSKYSTAIGYALSGDTSGILSSAGSEIGGAIGGDVGAAIGEGIGDIVAAVLSGEDVSGKDKKAIAENEKQLNQNADLVNNLADSGSAETEEISETAKSEMESAKVTIDDSANTITIENENTEAITIDIAEENQKQIDTLNENQKIIEEKQQEQQTLLSLINARKAELNIPAEMPENGNSEPVSAPAGDGAVQGSADDNSQQQTTTLAAPTFQPMQNSSDDSVLNGYIEQYNKCGMSIQACQQENIQLVEVVVNNNTEAATVQQETIEITNEELANIDNATNAIVSAADSAEGAIKEVQNLLNGQFPQLDKVTTIKLATSMTKSAICGTKSGIFAAAAAAMGVGSVFSFGSTAADAAKLTEQATASGENSALSLAKNAAGKIAQNAYTAYMQNTLGNIAETYGLNSEFTSQLLAEIGNIKSELPTTENSNQTNPIKQVEQTSTA